MNKYYQNNPHYKYNFTELFLASYLKSTLNTTLTINIEFEKTFDLYKDDSRYYELFKCTSTNKDTFNLQEELLDIKNSKWVTPYFRRNETVLFISNEFKRIIANDILKKYPKEIISLMDKLIREMSCLNQVKLYSNKDTSLKVILENPNQKYTSSEQNTTIVTDSAVSSPKIPSRINNLTIYETEVYQAEYVAIYHNNKEINHIDIIIEDNNPNKIIEVINKVKKQRK